MIFRIFNAGQKLEFNESDFPLSVKESFGEGLVFASGAGPGSMATFELQNGQVLIKNREETDLIFVNGKMLKESQQLKPGDEIRIKETQFSLKADAEILEMTEFEKPTATARKSEPGKPPVLEPIPSKKTHPGIRNALLAGFAILFLCVVYVLSAVSIRITVTPDPESISLRGFPPVIKIADGYLALPGQYQVSARKQGYQALKKEVWVRFGSDAKHDYTLQKLPGIIDIVSLPVNGAQVQMNGKNVGETPLKSFEIEAGPHELTFTMPRFLTATRSVDIVGMGTKQALEVALEPAWGTLNVNSEPQGVDVLLNGERVGVTPLITKPAAGEYKIELRKQGWRPMTDHVAVEAGKTKNPPLYKLQKVDGTVELTSDPDGARVLLNGQFEGNTPITLKIESEKEHQLSLSKNGFVTANRTLRVQKDEVQKITATLEPEYGTVYIMSQPAGATLSVDGQVLEGPASRRLRLITLAHTIEISKPGYQTFTATLTPTAGLSKRINAQLLSDRQVRLAEDQPEIKTKQGQVLRRIIITQPVAFEMGASRRESGRRSNETQYMVQLTRTFDISVKEVTNAEFKEFSQSHDSGHESGLDLNENDQPVASVEWDQAVRYLNWLSDQDGLPPAYEEKNGKMVARVPLATGYRLPTEAEWAFVARYEGVIDENNTPSKYPWGETKIPSSKSGNYADSSARTLLPDVISEYDDGFEVASPVGKFKANSLGIYDLGGNVAEWCHDYYDVYLGTGAQIYTDPAGPPEGAHHVIRGASWRHGSISELRWTYRDYSDKSRNDIGFRIARYADEQEN